VLIAASNDAVRGLNTIPSRSRNMRLLIALSIVLTLSFAASLPAQVTFAGTNFGGVVDMSHLPTAAYPTGSTAGPAATYPGLPVASLLPPIAGAFLGGMACDQRNAWIYTSNGFDMAIDENPNFLGFGPNPPSPTLVPQPLPATSATGAITGLAFDDAAGILWACNQNQFWGLNPLPPFNLTTPLLPIPSAGIPISGLGYDPCDGTLWACDVQGGIYHFSTGGAPIGLQPVNIVPTSNVLGGLTVATHNGAGAIPSPACSTQIPGAHILVQDGLFVHDAVGAAPSMPLSTGGLPYGLAYSSDHQFLRCLPAGTPGVVCSSGLAPVAGMRQPLISTGFNAIQLRNAPPATPAILLVDICPQLPCWFGLMMNPFSWTMLPTATDGFGRAQFGFFAGGFPKGFQFSFQWAVQDPFAPLGYCFSNVSTQTVGAP
jgi:hypothetical protein